MKIMSVCIFTDTKKQKCTYLLCSLKSADHFEGHKCVYNNPEKQLRSVESKPELTLQNLLPHPESV